MRHLDQATSKQVHDETDEALDEELARQMDAHKHEPIDAVLREVIDAARRWVARMELALPEHEGSRPEEEAPVIVTAQVHEPLLDEPTLVPPPRSNGVGKPNGHGHGAP